MTKHQFKIQIILGYC